jgi:uncharacterized protein (TIGR00288 family)
MTILNLDSDDAPEDQTSKAQSNTESDAATDAAILIDAENIYFGDSFSFAALHNQISTRARIVVCRAYLNLDAVKMPTNDSKHELQVVHTPAVAGKNTTDTYLMLDALELALTHPHIRTFVLVTHDRDFVPVVRKLRALGRHVIIAVPKAEFAKRLGTEADEVLNFSNLKPKPVRMQVEKTLSGSFELLEAVLRDANTPLPISVLKERMLARNPGFSVKPLGLSKFAGYIAFSARAGWVVLQSRPGGDSFVSLAPRTGLEAANAIWRANEIVFVGPDLHEPLAALIVVHLAGAGRVPNETLMLKVTRSITASGLKNQLGQIPHERKVKVLNALVQAGVVVRQSDQGARLRLAVPLERALLQLEDFMLQLLLWAEIPITEADWASWYYGDAARLEDAHRAFLRQVSAK